MEQLIFGADDEDAAPEAGLCQCGCGQPAPIAQQNNKRRGWVKGEPIRFIHGHGRRKPANPKRPGRKPALFVEAGQRIGYGVVIDPEIRIPDSSPTGSHRGARLLCDCGNEYEAGIGDLFRGTVLSCNCLMMEVARRRGGGRGRPVADKTGLKFGMVTVLRFTETKDGHAWWFVHCDCGNEADLPAWRLTATGNCGCKMTAEGGHSAPKGRRSPGEAARLHVLRQYQQSAKRSGRAWELSGEDFDRLTSSDCFYCGASPSNVFSTGKYEGAEFVYNGIDRINSAGGYVQGNVLPCCRICNIAKRDMPFDEFMAYIGHLAAYQWSKRAVSSAADRPALHVVKDTGTA